MLLCSPAAFANVLHKTDGSYVNRPFSVPSRTCGKTSFLRLIIYPAVSFVSFLQEKKSFPPSFLFRRKKRSVCAGSAAPQTDGRRHILRCRRSEYHSGYASLLRLVFARVRRACVSAFPCKPTTQKKINCGAAFLLCSCRFPQRDAQNGRFKCEPSSFLFRRKEAKENHLRNSYLPALLPFSPTCRTKRTVHIRTVRFYVLSRACGKASFLRLIIYPAVSFVSFLQEKKSFPLEEKKSFPCRRKENAPPLRRKENVLL